MNGIIIAIITLISSVTGSLITSLFLLRRDGSNATADAFRAFYLSYTEFVVNRDSPAARANCLACILMLRMFVPEKEDAPVSRLYNLLLNEQSDKYEVGEAFRDVCRLGRKLTRRAYRIRIER